MYYNFTPNIIQDTKSVKCFFNYNYNSRYLERIVRRGGSNGTKKTNVVTDKRTSALERHSSSGEITLTVRHLAYI